MFTKITDPVGLMLTLDSSCCLLDDHFCLEEMLNPTALWSLREASKNVRHVQNLARWKQLLILDGGVKMMKQVLMLRAWILLQRPNLMIDYWFWHSSAIPLQRFDQNKSKHSWLPGDKPHTPLSAHHQDAPLLKPMLNILFPPCVKIKPWESSDQKLQRSVSLLDVLPCACGVIRNSWWPMKNSRSLSTSTATWEREGERERGCLPCLARVWPIRVKAGQRGGELNGRSEESTEAGKRGDLLTHHQDNTFEAGSWEEMGAERRWRGDAGLEL